MKTYTLEVLEPANEGLVADILAALQKQRLIDFAETSAANDSPPLLSQAEVEQDILHARQQPSIPLAEARARFGL